VLDGEAIAHCLEGLPHFNRLLSGDGQASACLYAFDLLWLEAQDLRGVELIGRRRIRRELLAAGLASEHDLFIFTGVPQADPSSYAVWNDGEAV